jgi:hypothetical protein
MTAEVPGRELAGQPFFHRIRIGFEETASRIEAVERLTAAGKPLLTIAIVSRSTFRGPGVRSELPSAIDLFEYDPEKGDLMTKTRFIIRTLELNSPLEAATFEIDPEQAPYIWDEDARFWLKHPEPEFAAAPPR